MPFIDLEENVPGIRSLVLFRPETGKPLYELVQILLRGPSTLSMANRELIAAYVSHLNECQFCHRSHAAAAKALAGTDKTSIQTSLSNPGKSSDPKMEALLHIAAQTTKSGKAVTAEDIDVAKDAGADDREIHDTVLIAATFNMFNRYVDGLATFTPADDQVYEEMGERMAKGYSLPQKK